MNRRSLAAAAALVLAWAGEAAAQVRSRPDTTTPPAAPAGAPVVVNQDTLFRVLTGLGPFNPEERAAAIAARITRHTRDGSGADTVTYADSGAVTQVRAGTDVLMVVTEADGAAAGSPRAAVARQFGAAIAVVLQREGAAFTLKSLLLGVLWTLLATGGLVVVLWLFGRVFPGVYAKLESWRKTRIPAIRIQRLEVVSADRVTDAIIVVARVVRAILVFVVLYVYLPLVFSFFPWTRDLAGTLFGYVLDPLQRTGRAFINYLPSLFTIVVIVVVIRYVLKFIRLIFRGIQRGAIAFPGFYREWADPTYKIVRFLVIVFAAIIIYPYLPGSDTAAFQGISVFLGVLVSFGSSSAIANIVAGVVLTYMRPFDIGDRVRIADTVGDVIEKTLLVTRIQTIKNVEVTIPNAQVLASHIINYSTSATDGGLILNTTVTIGYDTPWRQVHDLLLAAAAATPGLLTEPAPFILQTGLSDFYPQYELNVYTDQPNEMARIYSALHQNIQDQFQQANVQITLPHYMTDPAHPKVPPAYRTKGEAAPPAP